MKKVNLMGIFAAAATIGLGHYAITGMEDLIASSFVAVHAGWGALALDVYRAFRNRGGDGAKTNGTSENDALRFDLS